MDIISSEQLRKLKKNQTVWSQWSFKKKIQTDFAYFPRPGENDPCVRVWVRKPTCMLYANACKLSKSKKAWAELDP